MLHYLLKLILIFTLLFPLFTQAQNKPVDELKLNLNEDGSHYLKWTFLNQVWIRHNQSNPGTTVLGDPTDQTFDIGLRRTRIQFYGQLSEHVFFYSQFGQNNFNYLAGQNATNTGNRKVQVFFHDVLGEYKVFKDNDKLKLGAGLTIANGLSRFSQPSIGTILTMDVPVFAQATVDQTDEFSRKLSIYARGQIGKLDYRILLSDPFPITTAGVAPPLPGQAANFSANSPKKQYQGLFIFNLLEKEPNTTPYMAGTYLGKKRIFNIEAGFITQQEATWTSDDGGITTEDHDMNLWSVAAFYDVPVNTTSGTAFSAYAGYFNLDYGPDYLRYNGIMNPANGIVNGPAGGSQGNAFPMFGTGQVVYTQAGFLLKEDLLGSLGTLMPYASLMSGVYERLEDPMNVYSFGLNWLLKGHGAKFSLDYQNRPVFENQAGNLEGTERKGQFVLQFQVSI